jgi:hypothetical protein
MIRPPIPSMSRPRRALLLSLVVCLSVVAFAPRASAHDRFDTFTTSNELPQNTVYRRSGDGSAGGRLAGAADRRRRRRAVLRQGPRTKRGDYRLIRRERGPASPAVISATSRVPPALQWPAGGRHGSSEVCAPRLQLHGPRESRIREILQRALQGRKADHRVAVRLPPSGLRLIASRPDRLRQGDGPPKRSAKAEGLPCFTRNNVSWCLSAQRIFPSAPATASSSCAIRTA